ncbi:glutamate ABC transporter substrate-binding protein [Streptomyces sp. NPDC093094]|uniref:glutamate ABC transporter substrate-binding protein n=1 Tax=Streptomyces sp. NPDC093094 TaxID=3366026 RepID=UPI0037F32BCD
MKLHRIPAAAAVALVLSVTATACMGDDGQESGSKSHSGETIRIGIKYDQPGLGMKEPSGEFSGFDVDVATYVANELGYDPELIEFVETKSADRENALSRGDVNFIVATYSITEERKEKVDFAGPYLLAHQDLLVKAGSDIDEGSDLDGGKLCSVAGSTSAQNVKKNIAPNTRLKEYSSYSECLAGLQNGAVDAVTTDDSILAGFAAQKQYEDQFELVGLRMSNENYGIGVKKGDTATLELVNKALQKMVRDGSWGKAVKANFGLIYRYEPAPRIGVVKE